MGCPPPIAGSSDSVIKKTGPLSGKMFDTIFNINHIYGNWIAYSPQPRKD
jgi:hypothetical protein